MGKYLSKTEVAARYNVTLSTIGYMQGNRLPSPIKIKGRSFWLAADLDEIDRKRKRPISPTAPVNCGFCGVLFTPKLHSRYCSQSCRQKGARKRHKEYLSRLAEIKKSGAPYT